MAFCRSLAVLPEDLGELQQLAMLDMRLTCHISHDYLTSAQSIETLNELAPVHWTARSGVSPLP